MIFFVLAVKHMKKLKKKKMAPAKKHTHTYSHDIASLYF